MLLTLLATLSIAPAPMVTLSIEGNGYLQFAQNGRALYTSSAPLTVVDGWLSNPNGAPLLPTLRVPSDTTRVDVDKDGDVYASTPRFRAKVGRISLATFAPGADLRPYGSYLVSSSLPKYKTPGDGDAGTIRVVAPGEEQPATFAPAIVERPLDPTVTRDDAFIQGWINRSPEDSWTRPAMAYSGAAEISVSSQSDVVSDQYTLGDIAVIDGDSELRDALMSAPVGQTPKPGRKANIRKEAILRRLESQGFEVKDLKIDIPRHAHIVRSGQKASPEAIKDAARHAATEMLGEHDLKASLKLVTDYAPLGNIEYEVESCTRIKRGVLVIVVMKVNGERYSSHVVRVSRR